MEERKIKFELSRVALIFVILFGLCVLIWTFILGVWIGTKIGGKAGTEEVAMEKRPEIPTLTPQVTPNATNETRQAANETTQNQTAISHEAVNKTEAKVTQEVKAENVTKEPVKEAKKEVKKDTVVPTKMKRESTLTEMKEEPQYKKKEVAHLATKIKEEPLGKVTIQVGAFSTREKAEQLTAKIKELGYTAEIREVSQEGKTLYKVYLGRFGSREEATRLFPIIKNKLAVDRPFIVELP